MMEEEVSRERDDIAERYTFVIVGGGIAGVTCAETTAICCPDQSILLLTESNIVKTVANLEPVARYLHKFDVRERTLASTTEGGAGVLAPAIVTQIDRLKHIEAKERYIVTVGGRKIYYGYLCICTGGRPRLIEQNKPLILGIRDTDSVLELQKRLETSKSVVLVGNGGIASELAYELKGIEVHWVVKDNHIASTFIDPGAAYFFQQIMEKKQDGSTSEETPKTIIKRLRYDETKPAESSSRKGAALGPDWHQHFDLRGRAECNGNKPIIHFNSLIKTASEFYDASRNKTLMKVELSTGEQIICDFIVSATGVDPRLDYSCEPVFEQSSEDHGIKVNEMMETSNERVYAAGDVCTAAWNAADHWFQMRLWTQARQMGSMAGRSMAAHFLGETIYQDFCFELFGHVTQLFGLSVILLGRYNGQGLGTDYEILLRSTPGQEYIKFILQSGRLRGAILIGNTELAETCENLILNGIDLTPFGNDILDPDIDIDDYFD